METFLEGIALQAKEDNRTAYLVDEDDSKMFAMPMGGQVDQEEFGDPFYSSMPKTGGGTVPVTYHKNNFRQRYLDEYTGEITHQSDQECN